MDTLHTIIPVPASVAVGEGVLPISLLRSYSLTANCPASVEEELSRLSRFFMLDWKRVEQGGEMTLVIDASLAAESWKMEILPGGIRIAAGDGCGLRYAVDALTQMLMAAMSDAPASAFLSCGRIEDRPRFPWRGLLLDSARHFQRPETIKAVIRLMARFRLNHLHWHLLDSEGFRIPSRHFPDACRLAKMSPGVYTAEEMHEIEEYAAAHDIEIVPELDAPGHFQGFLSIYPEYACDPARPGCECCLGNPSTLEMIKTIYRETVELLPRSRCIHVGGDEAVADAWNACPKCQAAMARMGMKDVRQLEHHVMAQLKDYVRELGRTPLSWSIPNNATQSYPMEFSRDDIIQTWLDQREPIFWAKQGNRVIYSLHTSLYLDYPRNFSETHEPWMFMLDERGVYLCEPFGIWADQVEDAIIGTEACLWTETVPEWRVLPKLLPRLPAYAECCWSRPQNKEWHDFSLRKERLEAAGYYEYLRKD